VLQVISYEPFKVSSVTCKCPECPFLSFLLDEIHLPFGYLTVRHGKSTLAIKNGKPSISMGHLYHGELLNNQMVDF
jgi:hypothetical protein